MLGRLLRDLAGAVGGSSRRRSEVADRAANAVREGFEASRRGDYARAERCLRQALQIDARNVDALCLLGELDESRGNLDGATRHYREALSVEPDAPDALAALGGALRKTGDLAEAAAHLERACRLAPRAPFLNELGVVYLQQGDAARAQGPLKRAVSVDPALAEAHCNLGLAYRGLGRRGRALACFERAVELAPRMVAALSNCGAALRDHDRHPEASVLLARAVETDPNNVDALCNLGVVLRELGRTAEACDALRRALALEPGNASARCSLGLALQDLGRFEEAEGMYAEVLAQDPVHPQARVNRGFARLLAGDFAGGWADYEFRYLTDESPRRGFAFAEWDGSALAGKSVLVYAEQGLGDEIMFANCIPDLLASGARCIIDCDPRLAPLFARSFPQATVHGGPRSESPSWASALAPVDFQVAAGSLPRYLRNDWSDFPRHQGYLRADPGRVEAWRNRISAGAEAAVTVGITWRGGLPRTRSAVRAIGLDGLLPLLGDPRIRFVSLQHGDTAAELAALRERHGIHIHAFEDALRDYDETAALVAALDLVISVCTAVVHLGGALGRPVWVLAPYSAEWRYLRAGEEMPWYPSVRVFRQPVAGDWATVTRQVEDALQPWLAGRGGGR